MNRWMKGGTHRAGAAEGGRAGDTGAGGAARVPARRPGGRGAALRSEALQPLQGLRLHLFIRIQLQDNSSSHSLGYQARPRRGGVKIPFECDICRAAACIEPAAVQPQSSWMCQVQHGTTRRWQVRTVNQW
jgi:hypothetical protein